MTDKKTKKSPRKGHVNATGAVIETIRQILSAERQQRGLSMRDVEASAKLPPMTIWRIEHARSRLLVEHVYRIEVALGIEPGSTFRRAMPAAAPEGTADAPKA